MRRARFATVALLVLLVPTIVAFAEETGQAAGADAGPTPSTSVTPAGQDASTAQLQSDLASQHARLDADLAALQAALSALGSGRAPADATPTGTPQEGTPVAATQTPAPQTAEARWKSVQSLVKQVKRDLRDVERTAERLSHRVVQDAHREGVALKEDRDDDHEASGTPTAGGTPTAEPTAQTTSAAESTTQTTSAAGSQGSDKDKKESKKPGD